MPVLRRTLIGLRWQMLAYGGGLAAWAVIVVLLFPSMKETLGAMQMPEAIRELYGEAASDLTSFRNFATVEMYQWFPVILSIYAITAGTGTLAGEEGRGALEILLTQPLSRRRVLLEKAAALTIGVFVATAIAAAGLVIGVLLVDLGEPAHLPELIGVMFATVAPVALLVGTLALLLGAIAPSRGMAAAVATAVVICSWLANGLADLTPQTAWLKYLSGFYYADTQTMLFDGPNAWHLLVIAATCAAQLGLAVLAFDRREIEVASWQLRLFARRR